MFRYLFEQGVCKENHKPAFVPRFVDIVSQRSARTVVLLVKHDSRNPAFDCVIDRTPIRQMDNDVSCQAFASAVMPLVNRNPVSLNEQFVFPAKPGRLASS
jgi:hypothetical protein